MRQIQCFSYPAQKLASELPRFNKRYRSAAEDRDDQTRQPGPAPKVEPQPVTIALIERHKLGAIGNMAHPQIRDCRRRNQILPIIFGHEQRREMFEPFPLTLARGEGLADPGTRALFAVEQFTSHDSNHFRHSSNAGNPASPPRAEAQKISSQSNPISHTKTQECRIT